MQCEQPKEDKMPLGRYRGLDLADEKGCFCAKILADLGVDVIKIEPPGGDPQRNIPPFYRDIPDPQRSLHWYAFHSNKRSITLDMKSEGGRGVFMELVKSSDFIIESSDGLEKMGLGYSVLSTIKPDIIVTSISPFGRTGPYQHFKACDLTLMSMGGQMYTSGDADRPPVRISAEQAHLQASVHAAIGTLAALHHRNHSGEGQRVDVSMMEAVVHLVTIELVWWRCAQILFRRGGPRRPRANLKVRSVWPCKDGQVSFMLVGGGFGRTVGPLVKWMDAQGMAGPLKDIHWEHFGFSKLSKEENEAIEETFQAFFLKYTKAELYEQALKLGFPLAPVNCYEDVLSYSQLKDRDFWIQVEHPELGETLTYPGFPYRFSETALSMRRRAPLIGEHNREIEEELKQGQGRPRGEVGNHSPNIDRVGQTTRETPLPLTGVKVVDFSWVVAGPLIGSYLATLGAEVIKIENSSVPDLSRMSEPFGKGGAGLNCSYHFNLYNSSKLSLGLNINDPRGLRIAKRLISRADVVIESFTPGKMKKRGLGYEDLKELKPDLIMLSVSSQGQSGRLSESPGFGWILNALCGFIHATGWPDREGVPPHVAYTDLIVPWYGVIAILAALDYHRRTGLGQHIDLAHLEAGLTFLAPPLLDCTVNGRDQNRMANTSPHAAPHGVYPCQGEDRWCSIAIFTDEEWKAFCNVTGNTPLLSDPGFADITKRKDHETILNELVSQWTRTRTAKEVMDLLQGAGIAAGVVSNAKDIHEDPHLWGAGFFKEMDHPEMGQYLQPNWPVHFSRTPARFHHAPLFGEHTECICRNILGMPEEEFLELIREDVLQFG